MKPIEPDNLKHGRLYSHSLKYKSVLRFIDRVTREDGDYVRFKLVSAVGLFIHDKDSLIPFNCDMFLTFYQYNFKYGK